MKNKVNKKNNELNKMGKLNLNKGSALLMLLVLISVFVSGCTVENNKMNQSNEKSDQQLTNHDYLNDYPAQEISKEELIALDLTLNDEYRAEAIYQKVLDKFGDVKPFNNIIKAEQKHSDSLIQIYKKYNLTIPENEWYDKVPEFESVASACSAGVDAEIENAALYDELISNVDNQDILAVFTSLRDASINNHLPAFKRCSER